VAKPPGQLLEFLHGYAPTIQSLALGLRTVVLAEMAPCHEYIFAMRSKVVLLYAATERVIADGICSINVFTKHITLAFYRGADFADRRGLLQGTGKKMRHVRLTKLSDLDRPELRAYLREARKRAGVRRSRIPMPDEVVTRVKTRSAPKRPTWPGTDY
jgi:hypothetical protein